MKVNLIFEFELNHPQFVNDKLISLSNTMMPSKGCNIERRNNKFMLFSIDDNAKVTSCMCIRYIAILPYKLLAGYPALFVINITPCCTILVDYHFTNI